MREFKTYRPSDLYPMEWLKLQSLARDAYSATLVNRSQEEINALVDWEDWRRFIDSRIDPNNEVGRRFNPNQSYTYPRVAVATENREPIGFAYSAYNVSGSTKIERLAKKITFSHNYLWLREVVVHPDYYRQGIATQLGRKSLKNAMAMQPVTAYIWPEEIDFLQHHLEQLGFVPTDEQRVEVFGEGSLPVRQVRMEAPSVHRVLRKLPRTWGI